MLLLAVDADGDGALSDVDCDDTNATVHPGAAEGCDGLDNDRDAQVDGDFAVPGVYTDISDAVLAAPPGATVCVAGAGVDGGCVSLVNVAATFDDVRFRGCVATDVGGAVYIEGGSATFTDVAVWESAVASDGPVGVGIQAWHGDLTFTRGSLIGNVGESTAASGGSCEGVGLHAQGDGQSLTMTNAVVSSNRCVFDGPDGFGDGAGVWASGMNVAMTNLTVDGNGSTGAAVSQGNGLALSGAVVVAPRWSTSR